VESGPRPPRRSFLPPGSSDRLFVTGRFLSRYDLLCCLNPPPEVVCQLSFTSFWTFFFDFQLIRLSLPLCEVGTKKKPFHLHCNFAPFGLTRGRRLAHDPLCFSGLLLFSPPPYFPLQLPSFTVFFLFQPWPIFSTSFVSFPALDCYTRLFFCGHQRISLPNLTLRALPFRNVPQLLLIGSPFHAPCKVVGARVFGSRCGTRYLGPSPFGIMQRIFGHPPSQAPPLSTFFFFFLCVRVSFFPLPFFIYVSPKRTPPSETQSMGGAGLAFGLFIGGPPSEPYPFFFFASFSSFFFFFSLDPTKNFCTRRRPKLKRILLRHHFFVFPVFRCPAFFFFLRLSFC